MIFDSIEYISRYATVVPIDDVLNFLKRPDLLLLKEPEIELRGRDLFVRLIRYQPKPAEQIKFEAHRVYADIQVLVEGKEIMQFARSQDLESTTEYDAQNDIRFFKIKGPVTELVTHSGQFAIFFPGEAHRPSCQLPGHEGENFKLVFKVRMGQ